MDRTRVLAALSVCVEVPVPEMVDVFRASSWNQPGVPGTTEEQMRGFLGSIQGRVPSFTQREIRAIACQADAAPSDLDGVQGAELDNSFARPVDQGNPRWLRQLTHPHPGR